MSRTRIVILRMREVIYTAVFAGLGILLLILLFFMFWPNGSDSKDTADVTSEEAIYTAGIYDSQLTIGESVVDLEVALDTDHVKSVKIVNLDDTVSAMYPLMKPSVKSISKQLAAGVTVDEVVLSDNSQYTEQLVLDAVQEVIDNNKIDDK